MPPEPVAVALDVDHHAVVEQPVQDFGGNNRITEEFLPVTEILVGGDDSRVSFIPVGDELEEAPRLPG